MSFRPSWRKNHCEFVALASTTSATLTSPSPATGSPSLPVCPARGNRRWRSTRSMPRGSGGTWSAFRLRSAVPRAHWNSPRRRHRGLSPAIAIEQKSAGHNPRSRSARSPRSTTICVSSTPGREHRIARLWSTGGATECGPDRGLGADPGRRGRGPGHGATRPRAQRRVPRAVRIGAQAGVHPRDRGRASYTSWPILRSSTDARTTTCRWSWTGSWFERRIVRGWQTPLRRRSVLPMAW